MKKRQQVPMRYWMEEEIRAARAGMTISTKNRSLKKTKGGKRGDGRGGVIEFRCMVRGKQGFETP